MADPLLKATPAQLEALEYMTYLYPDADVEVKRDEEGYVYYQTQTADRVAMINLAGDFVHPDPERRPTLTRDEYLPQLRQYRDEQEADNAANN